MLGMKELDSPLYTFSVFVYQLFILSLLWVLFSLPLLTIGASTTALFSVTRKMARRESPKIWRDFWQGCRAGFKQSTAVWLMLLTVLWILSVNLNNLPLFGKTAFVVWPLQVLIGIELWIVALYIFPIMARYSVRTGDLFKAAFVVGNRHLPTTIVCTVVSYVLFALMSRWGVLILFFAGLYGLTISYFVYPVIERNIIVSGEE